MSAIDEHFDNNQSNEVDQNSVEMDEEETLVEEQPKKKSGLKSNAKYIAIGATFVVIASVVVLMKSGVLGGSPAPVEPMQDPVLAQVPMNDPVVQALVPQSPEMGSQMAPMAPMPPMGVQADQMLQEPQVAEQEPPVAPNQEMMAQVAPQIAPQAPQINPQALPNDSLASIASVRDDIRGVRSEVETLGNRISAVEASLSSGLKISNQLGQVKSERPRKISEKKTSKAKERKNAEKNAEGEFIVRVDKEEVSPVSGYSVYAVKDGRAWLKDASGNTKTVAVGGSIGSAKVKSIDDVTGIVSTTAGIIH